MSPQEISDHKRSWMMANYFECHTHSDVRRDVTAWCKENILKWRYHIKPYTAPYRDSVRFESDDDLTAFSVWYTDKRSW